MAALAIGSLAGASLPATAASAEGPSYKPPPRGAPSGRVGLGTRGAVPRAQVWALAPEHTGLTTREQPSLYWYTTAVATAARIELIAAGNQGGKTLLDQSVVSAPAAGIQRVDLSRYGIRLQPGVEYTWTVTLEGDPKQRSNVAAIERIAASPEMTKRIATSRKVNHAAVYAEEGIWYDAIASLGELIEQAPNDRGLRRQRAALLEQVGLKEAAAGH